MIQVADVLPELTPMSWQRLQSAQAMIPFTEDVDVDTLQAQLDEMIAPFI